MAPRKRKHKSGAQKRREKHEAIERAAMESMAPVERAAAGDLEAAERLDYAASDKPPEDVVGRMVWVQGLMAKVIYWTGRHSGPPELQATRRTILDGGAKLGITAVKALYEERLKKLEQKVYGKRRRKGKADAPDGLEDLPPE